MEVMGSDLLGMGGYHSQLSDIYQKSSASSKMDDTLSKDLSNATDEELMDVCNQFEAYFLEQVMKRMEKMILVTDENSSTSQMVDYFKDTVIQDVALQTTKTQGLGLAQELYEAMKRQYSM